MSTVKDLSEENEELKKQLADALDNLKGYEKDYDEIVKECDALRNQLAQFKAEDDESEAMDDEEEAMDDEEAEEEDKEAEEDDEEAGYNEEAEEDDEEAEEDHDKPSAEAMEIAKALQLLNSEPVKTKPSARKLSQEEVLEKFGKIQDPKEKAQFYANHRTVIFN